MAGRRHVVWQRRPAAHWVETPSRLAVVEATRPSWTGFTTLGGCAFLAFASVHDLLTDRHRPVALSVFVAALFVLVTLALVVQWLTPMVEVTDRAVRVRGGPTQCFRFAIPGESITAFSLERHDPHRWTFGLQVGPGRRGTLSLPARLWLRRRLDGDWLTVVLGDAVVDERRLRHALHRLIRADP